MIRNLLELLRNLLELLGDLTIGPRCDICGERRRGWRTLLAHQWVDHGDRP